MGSGVKQGFPGGSLKLVFGFNRTRDEPFWNPGEL